MAVHANHVVLLRSLRRCLRRSERRDCPCLQDRACQAWRLQESANPAEPWPEPDAKRGQRRRRATPRDLQALGPPGVEEAVPGGRELIERPGPAQLELRRQPAVAQAPRKSRTHAGSDSPPRPNCSAETSMSSLYCPVTATGADMPLPRLWRRAAYSVAFVNWGSAPIRESAGHRLEMRPGPTGLSTFDVDEVDSADVVGHVGGDAEAQRTDVVARQADRCDVGAVVVARDRDASIDAGAARAQERVARAERQRVAEGVRLRVASSSGLLRDDDAPAVSLVPSAPTGTSKL